MTTELVDENEEMLKNAPCMVFMETQVENHCAIHTANNLLQGPRFCFSDFRDVALSMEAQQDVLHHSPEGDFSSEVIMAILAGAGIALQPFHKAEVLSVMGSQECPFHGICQGIFIHSGRRDHWYGMKFIAKGWYIFDSKEAGPQKLHKDILEEVDEHLAMGCVAFWIMAEVSICYQGRSVGSLLNHQGFHLEGKWDEIILEEMAKRAATEEKDKKYALALLNEKPSAAGSRRVSSGKRREGAARVS